METAVVNVISEYNNGLVKTQLMKYALTTGEVYPSTSRFSEPRDSARKLRQSEAATSQRAEVSQQKSMSTFRKKIKIPLMKQELFKKLSFIGRSNNNHNQTDHIISEISLVFKLY